MELGPSKEAEEWLRIAIADALEKHVRPRLPDLGGYKITLLARVDGRPEADVLVTEDERSAVFAMIDRRLGTPGPRVPGAVVIGPPGYRRNVPTAIPMDERGAWEAERNRLAGRLRAIDAGLLAGFKGDAEVNRG